ncbi:isoprenyl transferase [Helcococcus kunzii]
MDDNKLKQLIEDFSLEHIAIIMDGNGRWAERKGLSRSAGHDAGMDKVIEIIETADKLNIKYLSLYAFSTENWKRPKLEVSTLFSILNIFVKNELDRLNRKNVKVTTMGDTSKLPFQSRKALEYAKIKTKDNTGLVLNIGINYGSKEEIKNAIIDMYNDIEKGDLSIENIENETLSKYLYTHDIPDPDLLIRTGGELRLSNFMLFQLAYSEFYFTKVLWPDFNEDEFKKAIEDFIKRDRRFGGLNNE